MKTVRVFILGLVVGCGLTASLLYLVNPPLETKFETMPPELKVTTTNGAKRGCLIQEHPRGRDMALVFKGGVGTVSIDLPQLSLDRVVAYRWVGGNRALQLDLLITYHDSAPSTSSIEILYDFERGQIFVVSGYTLWRAWNVLGGNISKHWMTEAELDVEVERIDAELNQSEQ